MRSIALTALALGLLTTAAAAQTTDPTVTMPANTIYTYYSPTNPPATPNGDDTMVCNYQRETGSLITTRVCRTLRAWKAMQHDAQEFMEFGFRGSHQTDDNSSSGGGH